MAILTDLLRRLAPVAALVALLYAPRSALLSQYPWASSILQHPLFQPSLRTLIALGLLRSANQLLNALAQNNWHLTAPATWDWPREVAVVTGGSSGIGLELVRGLLAKGVRVAILDVQPPPADLLSAADQPQQVVYFRCDVTKEADVAATAQKVRDTMGADPSILINNAGIARRGGLLDGSVSDMRAVVDVNLFSMFLTTRHFVPAMARANKGHVVTVASLASFVALAKFASYGATKAAALAFHETLACELKTVYAAPGVVTTVVHPSFVRTPLVRDWEKILERGPGLLTIDSVARPVLQQVFSGTGAQIVVPGSLALVRGIRGWPSWVQEIVRGRIAQGGDEV